MASTGMASIGDLRNYDVTSDGTQFVVRVNRPDAVVSEVHVVLNLLEDLRQRVGNGND
jgi:predicted metal-dependent RNase